MRVHGSGRSGDAAKCRGDRRRCQRRITIDYPLAQTPNDCMTMHGQSGRNRTVLLDQRTRGETTTGIAFAFCSALRYSETAKVKFWSTPGKQRPRSLSVRYATDGVPVGLQVSSASSAQLERSRLLGALAFAPGYTFSHLTEGEPRSAFPRSRPGREPESSAPPAPWLFWPQRPPLLLKEQLPSQASWNRDLRWWRSSFSKANSSGELLRPPTIERPDSSFHPSIRGAKSATDPS